MKLLHIDSSILGKDSASRVLTADIVAAERQRHPALEVNYVDLAATPLDHLNLTSLMAGLGAAANDEAQDITVGREILETFIAADIVVIGAPMYNFAIPSQLKAWIDRMAVAGKTFQYTANGPVGLVGGKKVIVASTRGGVYSPNSTMAFLDHQEKYLSGVLGFLGITDIVFIRAEGLKISSEQRSNSMATAKSDIAQMAVR